MTSEMMSMRVMVEVVVVRVIEDVLDAARWGAADSEGQRGLAAVVVGQLGVLQRHLGPGGALWWRRGALWDTLWAALVGAVQVVVQRGLAVF